MAPRFMLGATIDQSLLPLQLTEGCSQVCKRLQGEGKAAPPLLDGSTPRLAASAEAAGPASSRACEMKRHALVPAARMSDIFPRAPQGVFWKHT